MRDYPIDRFFPVWFWPLEQAGRVDYKLLKILLLLMSPLWFWMLMPVAFPLLMVSMVWAVWDEVNE